MDPGVQSSSTTEQHYSLFPLIIVTDVSIVMTCCQNILDNIMESPPKNPYKETHWGEMNHSNKLGG